MHQSFLVVDEPVIAMDIDDVLQALGFDIAARAHSVAQALKEIRQKPLNAAVIADCIGDERSDEVADELSGRSIPFLFASSTRGQIIAPRFRNRPVIEKPFELPALVIGIARLAIDIGPERALPLPRINPYCAADLADIERRIATTKDRIKRIESLIWHRHAAEGDRLLHELRRFLATLTDHRAAICRALGHVG